MSQPMHIRLALLLAIVAVPSTRSAALAKKHRPRSTTTATPVAAPVTPPPVETPPSAAVPPSVPAPSSGLSAPAADPPPATAAQASEAAPTTAASSDLESLRIEYEAIRDELFRSRARLGLVGEAMFKTRLVVDVVYQAQREWPLARLTVKLDDKEVFAEPTPAGTAKGLPLRVFEGFAAAGKHLIAVSIESGSGDGRVGFAATGAFQLEVTDGKQTRVTVTADESGDGPRRLAERRAGTFDIRLRADVKSEELARK